MLADDKVRWKGEAVVAVLAETERAAHEAAAKVKVDYEVLPAVFDMEEALKPGAPLVNEYHGQNYYLYDSGECRKVRFGDVEAGFAGADHILEQTYQSSPIEHAPTETTGCIVVPEGNDRFTCYTNTQAMFFTLDNASIILQMPGHRLHFVGGTVGGGFGGKVDVIVEPIAILGAKLTGRPVSFIYSREEEMQISSPRAAEKIVIKDGVMKDGRIVARKVTGYTDAGAYSRHSPYGAQKGAGALSRPLHDPECLDRHLLRLHQPHAVLRHARLRRHHRRFRAGGADGQAGPADRHGPARIPLHQRLSRRRHEGAPPADRGRGSDRVHAGSLARRQLAGGRELPGDVVLREGSLKWRSGADAASPRSTIRPA